MLTNEGSGPERTCLRAHPPASCHLQMRSRTKALLLLLKTASCRTGGLFLAEGAEDRKAACSLPHPLFSTYSFFPLGHPVSPSLPFCLHSYSSLSALLSLSFILSTLPCFSSLTLIPTLVCLLLDIWIL